MGTPRKPRINTRKIYEDAYGKLPAGMEVHHKLPSRLGGSDDLSNLEAVTLEEHKQRHLDLYEKYGDWRDLTAYYMIGNNFTKAALVAASRGGKRAGELYKERGQPQGFQAFPAEKRRVVAAKGGSIGGRVQRDAGIGIHAQTPQERRTLASKGGHASCAVNGWRNSETQRENGRRGGPKNKGFQWYTDGLRDFKYTADAEDQLPLVQFLYEHPEFYKGRKPSSSATRARISKAKRHLAPSKNALAQRRYRERLVSETRVTEKAS